MKKFLTLAGVSAVALIAPATVGAATKSYNGTFVPGGTLSFDLKKTNKGKKILDYTFFGFPVQCKSGPETTSGHLNFAVKVKHNRFEANAQSNEPGAESKLTLIGKLKNGGQAEGTLKVQGKDVKIDDPPGARKNCSSPKTAWTASTVN